jgi:hypothetical protein
MSLLSLTGPLFGRGGRIDFKISGIKAAAAAGLCRAGRPYGYLKNENRCASSPRSGANVELSGLVDSYDRGPETLSVRVRWPRYHCRPVEFVEHVHPARIDDEDAQALVHSSADSLIDVFIIKSISDNHPSSVGPREITLKLCMIPHEERVKLYSLSLLTSKDE